jgi:hypothetical protein
MCPGNQTLGWFTCYVLCRHAGRPVWNFALPQTDYGVEKLTFLLPMSLPFFLSSSLTIVTSSSYYLPFLISIFMDLFSIHIYSSPPFFSISVFCFPYLPTNITAKWLSFRFHVPSSDGSLSWVKEFCCHFLCPRDKCCDTDHSTLYYQTYYYYMQQKVLLSSEM